MDIIIDQTKTKIKRKKTKKSHSFKKKKAKSILLQHGGGNYNFDNLIGIKSEGQMSCWLDSGIQMLWNIDCLRDYLLKTTDENIKELKPMTEKDKEEEQTKEKTRIHNNIKNTSVNINILENIPEGTLFYDLVKKNNIPDEISVKQNMILALKSIFKAYENKIQEINKMPKSKALDDLFKIEPSDELKMTEYKSKLVAVMTEVTFTKVDGTKSLSSIKHILEYYHEKEISRHESGGDPIYFIELTFILFENIKNDEILNLIKCFRFYYLTFNDDKCNIISSNVIKFREPIKDDTDLVKRITAHNTSINATNISLILFPETKFLLFDIHNLLNNHTTKANDIIYVNTHRYKLRACIMHTGNDRKAGHDVFLAYNDNGIKAALINGSIKTNLDGLHTEHVCIREFNPELSGTLYLYERIDEAVPAVVANDADVATSLAASLAAATRSEDIIEPKIAASALTATLAATQVGPDAINEPNVPAAITGTLAATQLNIKPPKPPASAMLTTAKPAGSGSGRGSGDGSGRGDGRGSGMGDGRGSGMGYGRGRGSGRGDGRGTGVDDPNRQNSFASDLNDRDRVKPLPTGEDEVKPYNGSLEPSSDSSGENMVLGVLLVITIAISGVLFVQR